jgi:hypothetical protein
MIVTKERRWDENSKCYLKVILEERDENYYLLSQSYLFFVYIIET